MPAQPTRETLTPPHVIATGGTFDKSYLPIEGQLGFDNSIVPQLLQQARLALMPSWQSLELIDSLEMNDQHRELIWRECERSRATQLVVIHGTDTMSLTADYLHSQQQARSSSIGATIVLTGAMVPARVECTDAFFNLGFALCAAQLLPAGVYIAMNGQVFTAGQVVKDRQKGLFVAQPSID